MLMHANKLLQIMNSSLVNKGMKFVNLMTEEATTAAFILDLKNAIEDMPTAIILGVPKAFGLYFKENIDVMFVQGEVT